jgi:hypothetical protein
MDSKTQIPEVSAHLFELLECFDKAGIEYNLETTRDPRCIGYSNFLCDAIIELGFTKLYFLKGKYATMRGLKL